MLALHDAHRATMFRASAAICATAILLLPVAAQSSRQPEPSDAIVAAPLVVPTVAPVAERENAIVRVRDPFRPTTDPRANGAGVSPVLVALASGPRSAALVEMNGRTFAIAVGDEAFGSRVVRLDARTVRLADGRTFALRSRP